jgi:hypothetical protein
MNSRLLRHSAGLVAVVLLLQSYFVRELVVLELFCAFSLIASLVIGGTVYLIGYAVLLWLEQPRRSHAEPQSYGKRGTSNNDPYVPRRESASTPQRFANRPDRPALPKQTPFDPG